MDAQERYRCGMCNKVHEDEDAASQCCSVVDEVYVCGKCEKTFDVAGSRKTAEQLAEQCCTDEEGNEIITLRDLEEEGQLRLIP